MKNLLLIFIIGVMFVVFTADAQEQYECRNFERCHKNALGEEKCEPNRKCKAHRDWRTEDFKFKASGAFTNTTGSTSSDDNDPNRVDNEVLNWKLQLGYIDAAIFEHNSKYLQPIKLNANIGYGKTTTFDESEDSIGRDRKFTFALGLKYEISLRDIKNW